MATTINQLVAERKNVFREFKKAMRRLDTLQEAAERLINRVIARRRAAPDAADYMELVGKLREVGASHSELLNLAEQYADVFR